MLRVEQFPNSWDGKVRLSEEGRVDARVSLHRKSLGQGESGQDGTGWMIFMRRRWRSCGSWC